MLKKFFFASLLLLGGLAVVIANQPTDFTISRSATINAPISKVFAQVNNLHNWQKWSPWAKLDPNSKASYQGPIEGVDSVFSWSGNNEVGVGKMTIIESKPNEYIKLKLDFEKPFKDTSFSEFTFKSEDGKDTSVTWSMMGKRNFVTKAISLVMNCEKMIGGFYEKGLSNLKTLVESI